MGLTGGAAGPAGRSGSRPENGGSGRSGRSVATSRPPAGRGGIITRHGNKVGSHPPREPRAPRQTQRTLSWPAYTATLNATFRFGVYANVHTQTGF